MSQGQVSEATGLLQTTCKALMGGLVLLCLIFATGCSREDSSPTENASRQDTPLIQLPKLIEITPPAPDDQDWQQAIQKLARQKHLPKSRLSLVRVIFEDQTDALPAMLKASKLEGLTADQALDGRYANIFKSRFVVIRHLHAKSDRPDGKDILSVGHLLAGNRDFPIDIPEKGKINAVGDLTIKPCPKAIMGHLKIEIDKTADIQTTAVTLGSVAVGGRYGEKLHPDRRWAIRVNTAATRRVQNRLPGF
ncbi:MAG: hypothetical protein CMJ19_08925 [Phycisphaeraceae bacterium]|nr:hypothetical protein [Phycisphaeraceae bacterium]